MKRRLAALLITLGAISAPLSMVTQAQALVPEAEAAIAAVERCAAAPACWPALAVGAAAVGVVWLGSGDQQKAAMVAAFRQAIEHIDWLAQLCPPCGAVTSMYNTIVQIVDGIFANLNAGSASVPLDQGDGRVLGGVAAVLNAHPLPTTAGWGAATALQTYTGIPDGWGNQGPVADAAQYSSTAQAVFRVAWTVPSGIDLNYNAHAAATMGGSSGTLTGSGPFLGTVQGTYVIYVNGTRFAASCMSPTDSFFQNHDEVAGGAQFFTTSLPYPLYQSNSCTTNVRAGAGDTVLLELWNTTGGLTNVIGSGILSVMGVHAYVLGPNWQLIPGSSWQQHVATPASASAPSAQAIGDTSTLPRSIPIPPASIAGPGLASIGDVLAHPGTTITDVRGTTAPVIGTSSGLADGWAGTGAGTATGAGVGVATGAQAAPLSGSLTKPQLTYVHSPACSGFPTVALPSFFGVSLSIPDPVGVWPWIWCELSAIAQALMNGILTGFNALIDLLLPDMVAVIGLIVAWWADISTRGPLGVFTAALAVLNGIVTAPAAACVCFTFSLPIPVGDGHGGYDTGSHSSTQTFDLVSMLQPLKQSVPVVGISYRDLIAVGLVIEVALGLMVKGRGDLAESPE